MSRIIAGAAGGTTLTSVPGQATRPTTDRVKEALFSRLDAYNILTGAHVLDLFAGSGSLGIEAASRGAATVDLVESADRAASACRANADAMNRILGWTCVRVHRSKVETYLNRAPEDARWDVVFLDPPYPMADEPLMTVLSSLIPHLSDGAVVVLERSSRSGEPVWPDGLERFAEKKYGETRLWYLEPA